MLCLNVNSQLCLYRLPGGDPIWNANLNCSFNEILWHPHGLYAALFSSQQMVIFSIEEGTILAEHSVSYGRWVRIKRNEWAILFGNCLYLTKGGTLQLEHSCTNLDLWRGLMEINGDTYLVNSPDLDSAVHQANKQALSLKQLLAIQEKMREFNQLLPTGVEIPSSLRPSLQALLSNLDLKVIDRRPLLELMAAVELALDALNLIAQGSSSGWRRLASLRLKIDDSPRLVPLTLSMQIGETTTARIDCKQSVEILSDHLLKIK